MGIFGGIRFLVVWPIAFSVMAFTGFGPAMVSIFLCSLGAKLIFTPANPATGFPDPIENYRLAFFMLSSMAVAWLIERNHRAEKAMSERLVVLQSREQLALALDGAGMGTWAWDLKTGVATTDARAAAILGTEVNENIFDAINRLVVSADRARLAQEIQEAVRNKTMYQAEFRFVRPDGSERWAYVRGATLLNSKGQAVQMAGVFADVTERWLTAQRLKETNRELQKAKEQAEQASRMKSAFLANMSHEIRTPMTAVLGFAELLREDQLSDEQRAQLLARIDRGGRNLLRLIDDILDISRIEAGKIPIERVSMSAVETAQDVISLLHPQAESKGVNIRFSVALDLPAWVTSDPARLNQILTNVIGNAVKFTPRGDVHVHLSLVDARDLRVDVRDHGIGISAESGTHLFQPFTQGDDSITRQYGGSGLGLILSRRLCRELGGDLVLVSSEVGKGSHFAVTIDARPFAGGTFVAGESEVKADDRVGVETK
jgi:PAS domain S-box-containing protein